MKRHLEPLAITTNIAQASFCHLDQVLMTFGHLVMQYQSMTHPEDVEGCTAIIESIEACWATADQEIFIAAVVLNPFYQSMLFAPLQFLTNAGIQSMLGHWSRPRCLLAVAGQHNGIAMKNCIHVTCYNSINKAM
jgi:hypothetical protein